MESKQEWRARIKAIRERLVLADTSLAESKICGSLWNADFFREAKNILFFMPLPFEPDISPLISECLLTKSVSLPRIEGELLRPKRVTALSDLVRGAFGILEPKEDADDAERLDLILVPALAIDSAGNRLGTGGGYYDRFLRGSDVLKIAIVYEAQIVDHLPFEPHDVRMDGCVTEKQVIKYLLPILP